MYSGITSGRVLDGELLYTKILEVDLVNSPNKLVVADYLQFAATIVITMEVEVEEL